ncbi:hypothetical protein NKH18_31625 [Streptomyces sp. M10(2022)]
MLAATITSCGSDPDRRCVDPLTQEKLPSYECKDSSGSGSYYYGGNKSSSGKVSGGSFEKSAVDRGASAAPGPAAAEPS